MQRLKALEAVRRSSFQRFSSFSNLKRGFSALPNYAQTDDLSDQVRSCSDFFISLLTSNQTRKCVSFYLFFSHKLGSFSEEELTEQVLVLF